MNNNLCEHFAYSRQELFEIVKIKELKTFDELIASHGQGNGCEVCKPVVTSILASLWNEVIAEPLHKKPYSLKTGECLSGEPYNLKVFPAKVEGDKVFLELPPERKLNALLATDDHCVRGCDAVKAKELVSDL